MSSFQREVIAELNLPNVQPPLVSNVNNFDLCINGIFYTQRQKQNIPIILMRLIYRVYSSIAHEYFVR